jgi:hypothetical protein
MADENQNIFPPPTIISTLLTMIGIVPAIGLLMLIFKETGITHFYFGFLFMIYWGAIMQMALPAFWPSLVGGLAGMAVAWLPLGLLPIIGSTAYVISMIAIGVLLFCFLRGHVRGIVNIATMLFLTLSGIPELNLAQNAPQMAAAVIIAALYMGAFAMIMNRLMARRAQSSQAVTN